MTTARLDLGSRIIHDWRAQLALVLLAAIVVRSLWFVGFGLGDDLGYIGHADSILSGHYPPLDPLNQYAYRPLLLYLFAAGIALFGHTDVGVVAPVFLASIGTTVLVFVFVRKLIDPAAAWWCALLFAFEPFNVVNSTTMTNDVILSCLTFAALTAFLIADRCAPPARARLLFLLAGVLMVAAFLVKIAFLPVLCVVALYSLASLRTGGRRVLLKHLPFYAAVAVGLLGVSLVYYILKGDLLWQFKAERFYYEIYKPDWYRLGLIDYPALMWQYPRSLFGLSGYAGYRYLDHGLLFWAALPAALFVCTRPGHGVLKLLVATVCVVFAFFEFYPQYLSPHYLPLVRQVRYLELLVPAAVIVVGTMLYSLSRRHRALALALLSILLADFVVEASRRSLEYSDSQQDVRELARYVNSTIAATGRRLFVDLPAGNGLSFYSRGAPVEVRQLGPDEPIEFRNCYVAVGGARSFWWSRDMVFDVGDEVPPHWTLTYRVPAPLRPWRRSNLRVYYVNEPRGDWYAVFDPPRTLDPEPAIRGLTMTAYRNGFDGAGVTLERGVQVPDLDNRTQIAAPRLQWSGWMHAQDAIYTFETSSDDGSWIELNGRTVLDNGGTHPARAMRRSVRLASGWYRFRLRYEDTGGDRFLRLRVYKNYQPAAVPHSVLFSSYQSDEPPTAPAVAGR